MNRFNPKPMHGFTTEELIRLRMLIETSWERVASDYCMDDEGNYQYDQTYDRFEVTEVALDADRWRHVGAKEGDSSIIDKLQNLGWGDAEWKEVIIETLPNPIYGF